MRMVKNYSSGFTTPDIFQQSPEEEYAGKYNTLSKAGVPPELIATYFGGFGGPMSPGGSVIAGSMGSKTNLNSLISSLGGMFGGGSKYSEPQYQAPQQQQTTLADLLGALKQNQPQQMDLSSLMRPMGGQQRPPVTQRNYY